MADIAAAQCSSFSVDIPPDGISEYNFRHDKDTGYGLVSVKRYGATSEVRCDLTKTFGDCEWGKSHADCVVDTDGSLRCSASNPFNTPLYVDYQCDSDQQTVTMEPDGKMEESMTIICNDEHNCTLNDTKGGQLKSVQISPNAIVCTDGVVSKVNMSIPNSPFVGINPVFPLDSISLSFHRVTDMNTCPDGNSRRNPEFFECVPPSR